MRGIGIIVGLALALGLVILFFCMVASVYPSDTPIPKWNKKGERTDDPGEM